MKLIKPYFEIIEQKPGMDGLYKHIETIGRVSYKSEDKITEDSASKFVNRMVNSGHGAVLEHGTVYLYRSCCCYDSKDNEFIKKYENNRYSNIKYIGSDDEKCNDFKDIYGNDGTGNQQYVVTTNLRVLIENNWLDDLKYMCNPTEHHKRRVSVKFTMDRIGSQSFCRHRVFSFNQESTRWCKYSRDKFDNEIVYILPPWMPDEQLGIHNSAEILNTAHDFNIWASDEKDQREIAFMIACAAGELAYMRGIHDGWTAEQARAVLPNSLKTEIVMTGFVSDWWGETLVMKDGNIVARYKNSNPNLEEILKQYDSSYSIFSNGFFGLRCDNHAHPQARELAIPLKEEFIKRGLL